MCSLYVQLLIHKHQTIPFVQMSREAEPSAGGGAAWLSL